MKNRNSKKGFTLVEIMIVVVIIGLLAAMAIPAFQKVRQNSVNKAMDNDARQLASAAQQYFLEYSVTTVPCDVTLASGEVTSVLSEYVKKISKGYASVSSPLTTASGPTLEHNIVGAVTYSAEGQR